VRPNKSKGCKRIACPFRYSGPRPAIAAAVPRRRFATVPSSGHGQNTINSSSRSKPSISIMPSFQLFRRRKSQKYARILLARASSHPKEFAIRNRRTSRIPQIGWTSRNSSILFFFFLFAPRAGFFGPVKFRLLQMWPEFPTGKFRCASEAAA